MSLKAKETLWNASCKAAQLKSLLVLCYGGGKERFEDVGEDVRDNIVWLASDLAHDIEELIDNGTKQIE